MRSIISIFFDHTIRITKTALIIQKIQKRYAEIQHTVFKYCTIPSYISKRRKMDAEWRNRTRREVPEAVPSVRRVVLFVHCAPFFKFFLQRTFAYCHCMCRKTFQFRKVAGFVFYGDEAVFGYVTEGGTFHKV